MKELLKKIHKVNQKISTVDKGGTNTFSKYNYTRLGDILSPLRPLLLEVGLVVTQSTDPIHNEITFDQEKGCYYTNSACTCLTKVYDIETGESLEVHSVGYSLDKNGDKAAYKAITGARKYGITSLFNLDWDAVEPEDDKYDSNRPSSKSNTLQAKPARRLQSKGLF